MSPLMLRVFLRNKAHGRCRRTNDGSVSSTHYVSPLLLQTAAPTKLLPVVQLRSGVILLMGDPLSSLFCVLALLLAGTGLALAKECQPMGGHGETTLEQGGGQDLFALTD